MILETFAAATSAFLSKFWCCQCVSLLVVYLGVKHRPVTCQVSFLPIKLYIQPLDSFLFYFILKFILCIWVLCLHAYVTYMLGAHGGQERVLDSLDLELLMFMSCHVGDRY